MTTPRVADRESWSPLIPIRRCWEMSFIASKPTQRSADKVFHHGQAALIWSSLFWFAESTQVFDESIRFQSEWVHIVVQSASTVCVKMNNPTPLQQCWCQERGYCVLGYRPEFVIETLSSTVVYTALGLATWSLHLVLIVNSVVLHWGNRITLHVARRNRS